MLARVSSCYVDGIMALCLPTTTWSSSLATRPRPGDQRPLGLQPSLPGFCRFLHHVEKLGRLEGVKLAYVGDGNNVATSLLVGGAKLGLDVRIGTPPGYG